MVEPFYIFGQPSWLWGGNDPSNMYVYNPSNFNVNYSNSSGWATGAGYADSLRSNGSVMSISGISAMYGVYSGNTWVSTSGLNGYYNITVSCAGFVKQTGAKICVYTAGFIDSWRSIYVNNLNINNTGNSQIKMTYTNHINYSGMPMYANSVYMFVFDGNEYRLVQNITPTMDCNCDDSRCGDDGF